MKRDSKELLFEADYEEYKQYCSVCLDNDLCKDEPQRIMNFNEFRESRSIAKIW